MEDEPCLQGAESCDSESYMSCSSDNLDLNSPSHDIDSDNTSDVSLQQAIPVQSNSVWSTGAQQNRDRFPFTGSPGMKAVVENKEDPLPFFEFIVAPDRPAFDVNDQYDAIIKKSFFRKWF